MPQDGDLALISQSGAIAAGLVEWAAKRSIGFSAVVSLGDQLDVDFGDLLDHFAVDRKTRAILLYVEFDQQRPQVHVGGARRRAGQARRGDQDRASCARRHRGTNPHRRPGRLRCRLRRRVPPCRHAARARPRRIVRRGGNARPPEAVSRQPPRDPHQRRRHRRAGGRPPDGSSRHVGGALARHHDRARRRAAADLVEGQSGGYRRRCRREPLCRRDGGAAGGS